VQLAAAGRHVCWIRNSELKKEIPGSWSDRERLESLSHVCKVSSQQLAKIWLKSLHHFVQRLLVSSVRQQVAKPQVLMRSQQNNWRQLTKQEERQYWTKCTEYVWRSHHTSQRSYLKQCANYRTIALVSHVNASKILLRIILERIRVKTEMEIADEQVGFREGRGIRDQITNIRILTKVMASDGITCRILIQNEQLQQVDTCPYVGSLVTEDGKCTTEFRAGNSVLHKIWKSHIIPISMKIRLIEALVWPVATYGCESWTLRKNEETRLDAFEMKGLRNILRVSWSANNTSNLPMGICSCSSNSQKWMCTCVLLKFHKKKDEITIADDTKSAQFMPAGWANFV